jgi:nicotinamidase-related amidase
MLASSLSSTSAARYWRRPWLVCMDLQREYIVPGRPLYAADAAPVTEVCRRVLAHAREREWRVVHTQQRTSGELFASTGHFGAPIEGLRPRISEPVFLRRGLSAFTNADFAAELRDARGEDVYLIGFSLNHTCLATALAAVDLGLSVTIIGDAMGVAPCGGLSNPRAGEIVSAILAPFVRLAASEEILAERQTAGAVL